VSIYRGARFNKLLKNAKNRLLARAAQKTLRVFARTDLMRKAPRCCLPSRDREGAVVFNSFSAACFYRDAAGL
jgi:hypothetical protein